ncbi:MAG: threonine synthase, partial [Flavobacteriaceae bacterium]
GDWVLELFHGPTLAFKDIAMQLLARMMDHVLRRQGRRATIVGATSGDTGGAAIEAFRGLESVDVVILYPHGRVSDVQRRQMTTVAATNVHALAVEGTFDDCQTILKQLFSDRSLREEIGLSGVNSINWARIAAQIVYYFAAASALGAPGRSVSFTVPTGNFGDIFAGYVASRMGLPVGRLVIATNENDILARTLQTGRYQLAGVVPTTSPSMDIQISSNFERLLFEAGGRDASAVRAAMAGLAQSGGFDLGSAAAAAIAKDFAAGRASERDVADCMRDTLGKAGYLLDPHTAVGRVVAASHAHARPMVTLSTAHPAKFPDAVKAACGVDAALPAWLSDLHGRPERFEVMPADRAVIADYLRQRRN